MKRILAVVLSLAMTVSLMVGCGSKEDSNSQSLQDTQTSQTTKTDESKQAQATPVTLRFSHPASSDSEKKLTADLKAKVEKKYPNITLEFLNIPGGELIKKISIMLAAGDVPDLVAVQDIADFVRMGALEPVDSIAAQNQELKLDNFDSAAVNFFTIDGKPYTFPISKMGYALLANEKLINKAGYKLEDLKTWDDLLKVSEAVAKNGSAAYGFASDQARFTFRDFYIAALSNGVTYDKLTAPENKQKITEIFDFYTKMKPYFPENWASLAWTDLHRYIGDDKLAFVGTGTYYSGYMTGLKKDIVQYLKPIPYPKGPSATESTSYVAGFGYSIFKDSKNKEESIKVLKEAVTDDIVAPYVGSMHSTAVKTVSDDAINKEVEKAYGEFAKDQIDILSRWEKILSAKSMSQPAIVGQTEIEKIYQETLAGLITGKLDSQKAYDVFVEKVKTAEDQYKK